MHHAIKTLFAISILLANCALGKSQPSSSQPIKFKTLPQEKIYLQLDKPSYVVGERIWFRAFLIDAMTHLENSQSSAIYVELINSVDTLIKRVKIPESEAFSGSLFLDETMPEGLYTIRAYTSWMQNAGVDYFFKKKVYIGNSITSQVTSSISYEVLDDKKALATIRFEQKGSPLSSKKIDYYLNVSGKNKREKTLTTNSQGEIQIEYNPKQIDISKPFIHVNYAENMSNYERNYILPANTDFDVQFFPEGGNLVTGVMNCISFKAIQKNGFSTEVSGIIYDSENKKVSEFKSTHLGMGKFCVETDSSKQLYALVKNKQGEEKRFDLPKAEITPSLSVNARKNKIFVAIRSTDSISSYTLLGHCRGDIFCNKTISAQKVVSFDPEELNSGINTFLLLNKTGEPISERLVFVKPRNLPEVELSFDSTVYDKREKVNCTLKITDKKGKPVEGSFALATTDGSDVQIDPTSENIINYLLLSSDLKGYIEKPNLYFDPNYLQADEALDMLMQTQGWKRFDTSKALKGETGNPPFYLEKGQSITGVCGAGLLNIKKGGVPVTILGPKIGFFQSTETNPNGRFTFDGFLFPDSTQFTITAKQKKGLLKDAVEIEVDKDSFPPIIEEQIKPDEGSKISAKQLEAANFKYVNENGMMNFNLKDVEVIAHADAEPKLVTDAQYIFSSEEYVLSGKKLESLYGQPFSAVVQALPGLNAWNENYRGRNFEQRMYADENGKDIDEPGPKFAWDESIYTYNEVQGLDVSSLLSVHLLKINNYNDSSDPLGQYLVVLNFKKGRSLYTKPTPINIITVMPLGYARNYEFYQPKYDVPSVKENPLPDWRSTLAWEPKLKTNKKGEVSFSFYTADRESNYNFVLEGITKEGKPCSYVKQYYLFKK